MKNNSNYRYKLTQKQLNIRIKPELYATIEDAAKKSGLSIRAFVIAAIDEKIRRIDDVSSE